MSGVESPVRIDLPIHAIEAFCQRWHVAEFALFGSVLRDDFGPASDVDVLVSFAPEAEQTLDTLLAMYDELEALLGRKVDLLTRDTIERSRNYIRREAILNSARTIYVAG